jgi:hypothetical protein
VVTAPAMLATLLILPALTVLAAAQNDTNQAMLLIAVGDEAIRN